MARKDTFDKLDKEASFLSDKLEMKPIEDNLSSIANKKEETPIVDIDDLPTKESASPVVEEVEKKPAPKQRKATGSKNTKNTKKAILDIIKDDAKESTYRTSVEFEAEIGKILRDILYNEDGRRRKGAYGLQRKIITNGVIRELIELGILTEDDYDMLESYEQ